MKDPRKGPKPGKGTPGQKPPGVEGKLQPKADHGEESYRGSGKLEGRKAIITGGDSGIGRAVAIALAREGADVAIAYLSEKEEKDAAETVGWIEKAGRKSFSKRFNVQKKAQCEKFVSAAVEALGGVDILVNNAAYQMSQESILDITEEQLEGTFRTNFFGYFFMIQACLPHMKEGAVIINSGSVTGLRGNPSLVDYAATKGAIHNLTRSLATQLAPKGIRVNCVAPGPVWTPLIPATMEKDHVRKFGKSTLWKRPAQPAEMAPSYVFLASNDSIFYTGDILAPTGEETSR